ncbi:MAG: hypothetical protein AAF567_21680 [Actinomycetota bacterium]
MSLDSHTTTRPTTFRDAARRVTTFQRAVLDSGGETIELSPEVVGRYFLGADTEEVEIRWPVYERLSRTTERGRTRLSRFIQR